MSALKRSMTAQPEHTEVMETQFSDDVKKLKTDEICPSTILHIRNLPSELNDYHLAVIFIPFGPIKKIILFKKKNQALAEMTELKDAIQLYNYYQKYPLHMLGKQVYIQFSNHANLEIKLPSELVEKTSQSINIAYEQERAKMNLMEHRILKLELDNYSANYSTIQLLIYKMFSKFGVITRMISFPSPPTQQLQTLIEFASQFQAHVAKLHLNGISIYPAAPTDLHHHHHHHHHQQQHQYGGVPPPHHVSCIMKIEFTQTEAPLQLTFQNDYSRDFESCPLNETELKLMENMPNPTNQVIPQLASKVTALANKSGVDINPNTAAAAANLIAYGVKTAQDPSQLAASAVGNYPMYDAAGNLNYSSPFWTSQLCQSLGGGAAAPPGGVDGSNNNILLVTNLNEQKTNPDDLFKLFGVYGDVQRVKILFNKKSQALIQFPDYSHAASAKNYLDGIKVWGKEIKIYFSKNNVIKLPKAETLENEAELLTKDYSESIFHRFKRQNSRNSLNIQPPNSVLHLSNLLDDAQQDDIVNVFTEEGFTVKNFRFFANKKMALIKLTSIEEAIDALMKFHNRQLAERQHLRVSFSKMIL